MAEPSEKEAKGLTNLRKLWAAQEKKVNKLKQELEKADSDKQAQLAKKDRDIAALEKKLAHSGENIDTLKEKLDAYHRKHLENTAVLENRNKELRELKEQIALLEAELNAERETVVRKNAEFEAYKTEVEQSENEFSKLKSDYDEVLDHLSELRVSYAKATEEKASIEGLNAELNNKLRQTGFDVQALSAKLEQTERKLDAEKQGIAKTLAELRASGWPQDMYSLRRDLVDILMPDGTEKSIVAAQRLCGTFGRMQMKPLDEIRTFVDGFVVAKASDLVKKYTLTMNIPDTPVDIGVLSVLKDVLSSAIENSLEYALPDKAKDGVAMTFDVRDDGSNLFCTFSDNGAMFLYEKIRSVVRNAGWISTGTALEKEDLLDYLFHPVASGGNAPGGLIRAAEAIERCGGRINATFDNGFILRFVLPKKYIFDKQLIYWAGETRCALPLSSVEEAFFLSVDDARSGMITRNGKKIPVLSVSQLPDAKAVLGLLIHTGPFNFLMPVDRIDDAETFLSFLPDSDGSPYFRSCLTVESGKPCRWTDLASFLKETTPPLATRTEEDGEPDIITAPDETKEPYMIFNSEPHRYGAVPVNRVLKVESMHYGRTIDDKGRSVFLSDGRVLPLRDSSGKQNFPYAEVVLIFADFALAVQNVADFKEDEKGLRNLDYMGRKIAVVDF